MSIRGLSQALVAALVAALFSIMPFATPQALAAPNPNALNFNNNVCDLSTANYLGSGSQGDPYQISDSDSLWEVVDCDFTNSAQAYFILTRDIDVRQATNANTSSPIGLDGSSSVHSFSGLLDGQNFSITNISMSSAARGVGLFEFLESAEFSNLQLFGQVASTANTGNRELDSVGGLARQSSGSVVITSISSSVSASGGFSAGGLIGYVSGPVQLNDSSNYANVSGYALTASTNHGSGGFFGRVVGSLVVISSTNFGQISGGKNLGGIAGRADVSAVFQNASNRGAIVGNGIDADVIGGLVGRAKGGATMISVLNAAEVSGGDEVGGFAGEVNDDLVIQTSVNSGRVSASGSVTGTYNTGGMVGLLEGNLTVGASTNSAPVLSPGRFVGGIAGYVDCQALGTISIQGFVNQGQITAGRNYVGGAVGAASGANVVMSNARNTSAIQGSSLVGGFVGYQSNGGTAVLSNLANHGTVSANYYPAGIAGGLQAVTASGLANFATVSASIDSAGGLVALTQDAATISMSLNSGKVVASRKEVGGIVGLAEDSLYLTNTYNVADVEGSFIVGGLVGKAEGISAFEFAYQAGTISGSSDVDGTVGSHSQQVTATSTFVISPSSHVPTTSLAQMRQASTFTGFDFDTVWGFGTCNDNNGLPMLRVFGELVSYSSTSCTVVPQNNPQNNQQQAAEPVTPTPPRIPIFDVVFTASPGSEVVVTGSNFDLFVAISADGLPLTISAQTDQSVTLIVPILNEGTYDLVALTRNAGVTYLGQLMIIGRALASEQVKDHYLTGLNPRSSWLNRAALDQAAAIQSQGTKVTCLAYQDRTGTAARAKALSRAEHACRMFKEAGYETKLVAYSKAPAMASRLKLVFSN